MKFIPLTLLILAALYLCYWLIGLATCDYHNPKFAAFARCLDALQVDPATVVAALVTVVLAVAWLAWRAR